MMAGSTDQWRSAFGLRLKLVRVAKDLNQQQMAKNLLISDRALKNYEKGLRDPPASLVAKVSVDFDIDARWLLLGDPDAIVPLRAVRDAI